MPGGKWGWLIVGLIVGYFGAKQMSRQRTAN